MVLGCLACHVLSYEVGPSYGYGFQGLSAATPYIFYTTQRSNCKLFAPALGEGWGRLNKCRRVVPASRGALVEKEASRSERWPLFASKEVDA